MSNVKNVVVPEGWNYLELSKLGIFRTSSVDKKNNKDEEKISLLNYMDVYRNNFIDSSIRFMEVTSDKQKIIKSNVIKGDMFFTPSSETTDDIGYSAVVLENIDKLLYSYHLVRLRFNENINIKFKGFFCNSEFVLNQFSRLCTGSTRFTLGLGDFNNTKVLLPKSLQEQQKIAEILSTVDEAIEKTDSLIEKYKKIKTGLMEDLFTKGIDVNTGKSHTKFKDSELGRIPESWDVDIVGNLCNIFGGYAFNSKKFTSEKGSNQYQVLKMGNVQMLGLKLNKAPAYISKYNIEKKELEFLLKESDILISLTGTINKRDYGNISKVNGYNNLLLNQRNACFRVKNKLNNYFLYTFLQLELFREQFFFLGVGGTGNQANVGTNDLKEILINFPNIKEQEKIADILTKADNKIEKEEIYKEKLMMIKKGLMSDLLTGKVRVEY